MSRHSKFAFRQLFLTTLAIAAFAGPAQALNCPSKLPDQALSSSSDGATMIHNVTLRSSHLNPAGTTILCRYRGEKVTYPARGNPIPGGSVSLDRYRTADSGDPPQAWTVRLFNLNNLFQCTGAAIAPDWVVTAYHCTDSSLKVQKGSAVMGGVAERTTCETVWGARFCWPNPMVQTVAVASIHRAPKGDIALLKLATPLVLTRYGIPAYGESFDGPMENSLQCALGVGCTRHRGTLYGWTCSGQAKCPQGREAIEPQSVRFWAHANCGTKLYPRTAREICSTGGRDVAYQGMNSGGPLVAASGGIAGVLTGNSGHVGAGNMQFGSLVEVQGWIQGLVGADAHPRKL